ncbi:hypothetical protein PFISCL1PPCAC_21773, partial [Pristionchus fissidentatus]
FLCDCGHKTASISHSISSQCEILNFKIIFQKKNEGLKCIFCESRPSTAISYTHHLKHTHNSSLNKNGLHLQCSCCVRIHSDSAAIRHYKKCDERRFTVENN